jgi:GTP-binding protein EngB required for normal cell division
MEDLERTVKLILNQQRYAKFVNSVLNGTYVPEKKDQQLNETVSNLEKTVEMLLEEYDKISKDDVYEDLDEMCSVLKGKFTELEENILKMMEKKHLVDKEVRQGREANQEELDV